MLLSSGPLPFEVARPRLEREHFPDRAGKVMHIINEMRGGHGHDPKLLQPDARRGPWGR